MPLFGSTRHPEPAPAPEPEPMPRKGLFHRREPEPGPQAITHDAPKKHSLFHRRTSSPSPPPVRHSNSSASSAGQGHATQTPQKSKTGSLLSKFGRDGGVDPSIVTARERVMSAEAAEVEADRALDAARTRVHEAKEHVKKLEAEAAEEARRARVKQHQAREVSKRGEGLGRHG